MTDDPYIWIAAILCLLFSIGILWLGVEIANAPLIDEPTGDLPQGRKATSPLTDDELIALYEGRNIHNGGES